MRRNVEPTTRHHDLKIDLAALLRNYQDLAPVEILAVSAQIVGMLIAIQDQRTVTPESAMKTVLVNIEMGNLSAIEPLGMPGGSA